MQQDPPSTATLEEAQLCLSGSGFSTRLRERTRARSDLLLVTLDDIYTPSR